MSLYFLFLIQTFVLASPLLKAPPSCSIREAPYFLDFTQNKKKLIAYYHIHGNPLMSCPWIYKDMTLTDELKSQIRKCLKAEEKTLKTAESHIKRFNILHRAYKFKWIGGEMSDDDSLKILPERIWLQQLKILEILGFSKAEQNNYSIIINSLAQHFALTEKIPFEALEDDRSRRKSLFLLQEIVNSKDIKERKQLEAEVLEQTKVRDATAITNAFRFFDRRGNGLIIFGKSHRENQKLLIQNHCKN